MNLLRSEWIKLFSTRTTWVMIGIGLLGEAFFAGLFVALAPLAEIGKVDEFGTGVGLILVLMLVLGVLLVTTEFRHGTSSSTFLASPRRYPALVAKLALALVVGGPWPGWLLWPSTAVWRCRCWTVAAASCPPRAKPCAPTEGW